MSIWAWVLAAAAAAARASALVSDLVSALLSVRLSFLVERSDLSFSVMKHEPFSSGARARVRRGRPGPGGPGGEWIGVKPWREPLWFGHRPWGRAADPAHRGSPGLEPASPLPAKGRGEQAGGEGPLVHSRG